MLYTPNLRLMYWKACINVNSIHDEKNTHRGRELREGSNEEYKQRKRTGIKGPIPPERQKREINLF